MTCPEVIHKAKSQKWDLNPGPEIQDRDLVPNLKLWNECPRRMEIDFQAHLTYLWEKRLKLCDIGKRERTSLTQLCNLAL